MAAAAATNTTFGYTTAGTTGTNSANLTLSNATGGADNNITIDGIETINLTSNGSLTNAVELIGNAVTTLNVTGGTQAFTLTNANTTLTKIDATNFTKALTAGLNAAGTIIGGSAADTLSAKSNAAASITGGDGNDTITGSSGNDTLAGGNGDDSIVSGAGNDNIAGGAGNDTVDATGGLTTADTIDGGTGTNTLIATATNLETVSASTPTTYNLTNFNNLNVAETVGADADTDVINVANVDTAINTVTLLNTTGSTASALTFNAGSSTLNLNGALGAGLTLAASGTGASDSLTVVKNSTTAADSFADKALAVSGYETLNINTGATAVTDTQTIGTVAWTPTSATQNLSVNFTGVNEVVVSPITTNSTGLLTVDFSGLTAQATDKTATLEAPVATGGTVSVIGSAGNDDLTVDASTDYNSTIKGGAGNDTITGGSVADLLEGEAGNDSIVGGGGNDTLRGGDGNDTITGGAGTVSIEGGAGNDTIIMADTFTVGDVVNGGTGVNTLSITAAVASPSVGSGITNIQTLSLNGDVVQQDMSMFTATTISRVDSVVGNNDIAIINAAPTLTELRSTSNSNATGLVFSFLTDTTSDSLTYGAAADAASTVAKLTANDVETLTIGQGALTSLATVQLTSLVATDLVTLNVNYGNFVATLDDQGSTEVFTTLNAASNTGTVSFNISGQDVTGASLTGSATAANTLVGGGGNDSITGGSAADSLTGNAGNDTIIGGAGNDTMSGGAGVDSITGGDGVDSITGGTGADILDGGAGNDVFVYASTSDTGLASTGTSTTTTALLDKITVNAGDTIALSVETAASYDTLMTLQTSGAILGTVTATGLQQITGVYDATAQTFTVGTTGANSVLVQWAVTDAGTTATQSAVLIGVTQVTDLENGIIIV